jgi:hypothetical protein
MGFSWKQAGKNLTSPQKWIDAHKRLYNDTLGDRDEGADMQRQQLGQIGQDSSDFANQSQGKFGTLGNEAGVQRKRLNDIATGKDSISSEQLRQGLQQNLSAQRSMAASAAPRDSAMAGRTAAMNAGRMGAGMSGQAAMAGMQERRDANSALANLLMQQRQQELQATLGGRQTAVGAYQGMTPEGTFMDKYSGAFGTALSALVSDRRAKEDIEDGDDEARRVLDGLKAYSYKYKDEKHGKGKQLGVMAQDLERAGLKQAVVEGPGGTKELDAGKLAGGLAALVASQHRRIGKLEKAARPDGDRDPIKKLASKFAQQRAAAS